MQTLSKGNLGRRYLMKNPKTRKRFHLLRQLSFLQITGNWNKSAMLLIKQEVKPVPGLEAEPGCSTQTISSAALRVGQQVDRLRQASWNHAVASPQVSSAPEEPRWAPGRLPRRPHCRRSPQPPRPLPSGTQRSSWVRIWTSSAWWGSCWGRWLRPQQGPFRRRADQTVAPGPVARLPDPPEYWERFAWQEG